MPKETAQTLWEARYLLARVEGAIAVAMESTWPLVGGVRQGQLLAAAAEIVMVSVDRIADDAEVSGGHHRSLAPFQIRAMVDISRGGAR